MDCAYANDPVDDTLDYPANISAPTVIGPVKPGKIDRDVKCEDPLSASVQCGNADGTDDHREVITGVDIDNAAGNGTGTSSLSAADTFYHNKVTVFFNNSSAGTMTVQGMDISWVNPLALLTKVTIGGGRSGIGETSTSITAIPTVLGPTPPTDPSTRALSAVDLTDAVITADARYVPITFEFKDSGGTPNVDMRDDIFRITLNVRNDTSGSTSCVSSLTVSETIGDQIFVPFGPSITATQQDRPDEPTQSFAVPGATGSNIVVAGVKGPVIVDARLPVNVSALISGNTVNVQTGTKVNIASGKLFYKDTTDSETVAPTSGFIEVTMTDGLGNPCAGFTSGSCTGQIPALDGRRVWYYIVTEDEDGNFDRDPEIGEGAYVYDQKTFDICDVTPEAPTGLSASPVGLLDVNLAWTAPTSYTNGVTIDTSEDPITYSILRDGLAIVTGLATTTYTDTVPADNVYSYNVIASNSCSTPTASDASATAAVCVGITAVDAEIVVSPSDIVVGESYRVEILDCVALNPIHNHIDEINTPVGVYPLNDMAAPPGSFTNTSTNTAAVFAPPLNETGPLTGKFIVDVTTGTDASADVMVDVSAGTDTITVFYTWAVPSTETVTVKKNPCDSTPAAPTGLGVSTSGNNVNLTWSAVTSNDDATAIADLAGYRVYEKVEDNSANLITDWFVRTTVVPDPITTDPVQVTVGADQGALTQRVYTFRVTAVDECAPPKESLPSAEVSETK
jgi:hypothetical protein